MSVKSIDHQLSVWNFQVSENLFATLKHTLFLSGTIFNNAKQHINVYGDDVEVDYRGYEVGLSYLLVYGDKQMISVDV